MSGGGDHGGGSHKPGQGHHEEEHEEHVNHEAWVIPYADMLTLLMALFLMLWATSESTSDAKFAALANSLRDAFTGQGTGAESQTVLAGAPGIMTGQPTGVQEGDLNTAPSRPSKDELTREAMEKPATDEQSALAREKTRREAEEKAQATLNGVQKRISEQAAAEGVSDAIKFRRESRGLVVTVVADHVLFDSGSAALRPGGQRILTVVAEALKGVPNEVVVEGHTDNTAINTPQFPSNWELSASRGTSVLRYIVDGMGFDANRISSSGYGETRPIVGNETDSGRSQNRRVEVVVLSEAVQ